MSGLKSFSLDLDDSACTYLKELSTYLGVKEVELIRLFIEAARLNFPKSNVEEEVEALVKSFKVSRFDALRSIVYDTLYVGELSRLLFKSFFKEFNCSKMWPSIEDIMWFEDHDGFIISFNLEKSEFINKVIVTLFTNGSDYIQIWSHIGYRDELQDKYDKIKKALAKAVDEIKEEMLFEELQDDMDTDLDLNILDEDGQLSLVLEGSLSDRRLPDFMKVEKLFKKLYKKASPKK
ncbi:MAG: hypothetical protein H5T50_07695 [Nitrososphaeria archaeon]|nr:hypothetical protein [Nitrososphaeria archaeon]